MSNISNIDAEIKSCVLPPNMEFVMFADQVLWPIASTKGIVGYNCYLKEIPVGDPELVKTYAITVETEYGNDWPTLIEKGIKEFQKVLDG